MDAITLKVIEYGIEKVAERFGREVIARWSRFRANRFFASLLSELRIEQKDGEPNQRVDDALDKVFASEASSEVLFEAYRKVCLASSKELGPKIIGILTAQIIAEGRKATPLDEDIASAAESLTDEELLEFAAFFEETLSAYSASNKRIRKPNSKDLEIVVEDEHIDSNWHRESKLNIGAINLRECFGSWALKMRNLGLIAERIDDHTVEYKEDSERHIDEPGTLRSVEWIVILPLALEKLVQLVRRVQREK